VIRYFVSPPLRSHRLEQAAHRASCSIANADAPLANELATTVAFGGHRCRWFRRQQSAWPYHARTSRPSIAFCSSLIASRPSRFMSAAFRSSIQAYRLWLRIYQCFDRRTTRKVRHRLGSNVRRLARSFWTRHHRHPGPPSRSKSASGCRSAPRR